MWDAKKCMGLLKTVFEGLPMPAVMLHQRTFKGEGTKYEVVDGKQRLATLYTFIKGACGRRVLPRVGADSQGLVEGCMDGGAGIRSAQNLMWRSMWFRRQTNGDTVRLLSCSVAHAQATTSASPRPQCRFS